MSRSERLLELLQALRRHRRPVSGKQLAAEAGVSIRTLYRDIATLQGQGAEIAGEPGVGYILRPGFMLPPLMFSENRAAVDATHADWQARRLAIPQAQTEMDFGRTFVALDPDGHRLRVFYPAQE